VLSTELGPRDTESGGERRAAAFLAREFQAAGLRVQQQGFSVGVIARSEPRLTVTAPAQRDVNAEPMIGSDEGVGQGALVFGGLGKAADLPAGGLKGKVALFERGEIRFQEKAENAARAGAVAVVVSNNAAGPLFGSLLSGVGIPVVGISRDNGQSLKELLAQGEVVVRVAIKRVQLPSANVIAELPADGPVHNKGGIVIIGGHYDTIPGVPGANDNGSGTAVLLTLAKEIAAKHYPFTVRLVGFGAEELGLWGSRKYVESLPAEERSRIQAVMNLDVVGAQVLLGVLGDATLVQDLKAQASSMGLSLGAVSGDVSSDHLSFSREGIPAVILTTPDFSVIHTPEDTVDRVDPLRLGQTAALVLRYLEALGQR
jgi:aminopeptidase YwaD